MQHRRAYRFRLSDLRRDRRRAVHAAESDQMAAVVDHGDGDVDAELGGFGVRACDDRLCFFEGHRIRKCRPSGGFAATSQWSDMPLRRLPSGPPSHVPTGVGRTLCMNEEQFGRLLVIGWRRTDFRILRHSRGALSLRFGPEGNVQGGRNRAARPCTRSGEAIRRGHFFSGQEPLPPALRCTEP